MKKASCLLIPQRLCPAPAVSRPGSSIVLMSTAQAEQIHIRITISYQHLALPRWPCTEESSSTKGSTGRKVGSTQGCPLECAFQQALYSLLNFFGTSISMICTRKKKWNVHSLQSNACILVTTSVATQKPKLSLRKDHHTQESK